MIGGSGPGTGSDWGWAAEAPLESPLDTAEADRYVAAGLIGAGAMGQVEAVRDLRLGREVARKLPAPDLDPELGLALLAYEARITATLDHPNVVAVHDAGRLPDGRRYFTMRLVRGRTFAQVVHEADLPADLPRLVRHLLDATRALAHAHGQGVVHTDVKPSNLLVGPYGEAQVSDWGLARRLGAAEAPPFGPGAGTPPYRAPEVEAGREPGPAADVFAVGVMLREVLDGITGDGAPVELAAVARRATQTDPAARYPDAAALGDDLARWLDGRPVVAHAYTPAEMVRRLLAAWRAPLTVGAVAMALLAAAVVIGAVRTAAERDRAVTAERASRETATSLWVDRAVGALRREDRPEAERAARAALALREDASARGVLAAFALPPVAVRMSSAALPEGCEAALRLSSDGALCGGAAEVRQVDLDGRVVASWPVAANDAVLRGGSIIALSEGQLVEVDRSGARVQRYPSAPLAGLVAADPPLYNDRSGVVSLTEPWTRWAPCGNDASTDGVAVASDGTLFVTCSEGGLVRRDPGAPPQVVLPGGRTARGALAVDVGPRGDWLLLARLDGTVVRVDARSGATLAESAAGGRPFVRARVSPDGAVAALVTRDGAVRLWRTDDGADLGRLDLEGARDVAWTADGELLVAAAMLERWRLPAGAAAGRWPEGAGIASMALSPDGARLAVGLGGDVVVRETTAGVRLLRRRPFERTVKGVAFLPDGRTVVAASSQDGQAPVRVDEAGLITPLVGRNGPARRILAPPGGGVLVAPYAPVLWWWPAAGPVEIAPLPQYAVDVAWAPGGRSAWVLDDGGDLYLVEDGVPRPKMRGLPEGGRLSAAADRVFVASDQGVVVARPPDVLARWTPSSPLTAAAASPDGERMVLGEADGDVLCVEAATGRVLARAPGHSDRVSAAVWLDPEVVFTGSWDGSVRRWRFDPP